MKPITTSVYTFRDLRQGGFLYVDKTALCHQLVSPSKGNYFLSRPRRFGKSLTLSTLGEILAGNRALFQGLAMDALPYDWKPYPVIRLDISRSTGESASVLKEGLMRLVERVAEDHKVVVRRSEPQFMFDDLIRNLAMQSGSQVAVLIDEYDKPILGNATQREELPKILAVLKAFYSVVKAADEYLRFVFITGVSKFAKVSIFSDLNNLTDLTMKPAYASLCGYTQEELEANFAEHIEELAKVEGKTREQVLAKIRHWYNGYRFSEAPVTVYNPVSAGKLFTDFRFDNYWFETGTPTMLVNLMRERRFDIEQEKKNYVQADAFSAYEVEKLQPLPLCFQTGYLTIKEVVREESFARFLLDYPNNEVEASMTQVLLAAELEGNLVRVSGTTYQMVQGFLKGDLEAVFQAMRSLFASLPYSIQTNDERYYQSLFVMVFKLLGFEIAAEVQTDGGRIDAVVKNPETIYVIEFKLNGTADEALVQIREKRYGEPYLTDGRKVVAVGVEFAYGPEFRNIRNWKTEDCA